MVEGKGNFAPGRVSTCHDIPNKLVDWDEEESRQYPPGGACHTA